VKEGSRRKSQTLEEQAPSRKMGDGEGKECTEEGGCAKDRIVLINPLREKRLRRGAQLEEEGQCSWIRELSETDGGRLYCKKTTTRRLK